MEPVVSTSVKLSKGWGACKIQLILDKVALHQAEKKLREKLREKTKGKKS